MLRLLCVCVHVRGVVTYILPIEAFVTRINNLDRLKVTLDLFPSKVLDHLNLQVSVCKTLATPP